MAGKSFRILVADDSLTIQKVIRLALSNEGYDIQAVSDGNDALQQISLFNPDVVLIDVSLPGKNAFEVKSETASKTDLANVRFILMSSAFENVDEEQVKTAHFNGRLVKPFDPANLRKVITETLEGVQPRTAPVDEPTPEPEMEVAPPEDTQTHPEIVSSNEENTTSTDLLTSSPQENTLANLVSSSVDSTDTEEELTSTISMDLNSSQVEVAVAAEPEEVADSAPAFQPLPEADSGTSTDISDSTADEKTSIISNDTPGMGNDLWEPKREEAHTEDIKELTESTIKMSGLDEFQWTVEDDSKKRAPFKGPPGTQAPEVGEETLTNLQAREPSLAPPPEMFENTPPQGASAQTEPEPEIEASYPTPPVFSPPASEEVIPKQDTPAEPEFTSPLQDSAAPTMGDSVGSFAPMTPQINKEELEAIVERQVRDTIQQMAREVLPDVAEKVLKDEIHRLLSNPPINN